MVYLEREEHTFTSSAPVPSGTFSLPGPEYPLCRNGPLGYGAFILSSYGSLRVFRSGKGLREELRVGAKILQTAQPDAAILGEVLAELFCGFLAG
jgi:hypothetical protein